MQPSIGSLRRPARTDIVMDHLNDTISLVMEQKKQLRELFSAPIDLPALVRRLEKPKGPVDVVIDTDAYNEIDDQYAISYLVKKSDKLKLQALYAAPFFNDKSTGPEDGMEKSYQEILKLLKLMGRSDLSEKVYRGSVRYLPSETEPVQSDAAKDLAERAMGYTPEKPLYVVAIGAITNVASALLLNPDIRDRIVVVWLGGNAHEWEHCIEFNLIQDVAAARVLFGCGAAVVQLPCMGVVSTFTVSGPELEKWFQGKNELCDYLCSYSCSEGERESRYKNNWTRVIWDVTTVGWLADGDFMNDCLKPSPIPEYDGYYAFSSSRHPIRYVNSIHRDALIADLVKTLTEA